MKSIFPTTFLKENLLFILIVILFLFFRIANLTSIPIFNDEAIYLDWGWRETTSPGNLFYSLYDAKQPLLMWFFGISEQIFLDPLFAGRLISVMAGLVTLFGLYTLCKEYFTRRVGYLTSLLYIVSPLFSFFDRQALMESAIGSVGVWVCYFLLRYREKNNQKYLIFLGITLGIGLFIKSSAVLFFITTIILLLVYDFVQNKLRNFMKEIGILIGVISLVDFLLIIQPMFWQTLSTNSRYTLTIAELFKFPIMHVITNLYSNVHVLFFFTSPAIFIFGLIGIRHIWNKRIANHLLLIFFFFISFLLQIIFVKNNSQRYIVAFLPLFLLFSAYYIERLFQNKLRTRFMLFIVVLLFPGVLTVLQIVNPVQYLTFTSYVSPYAEKPGYTGQGYMVGKAVVYLKEKLKNENMYIATAINTGNPESAIMVYFQKENRTKVINLEASLFSNDIHTYECLLSHRSIYFVSRDEQQGGLNKFLRKEVTFTYPYGHETVGIYKLKQNCTGKTLNLD